MGRLDRWGTTLAQNTDVMLKLLGSSGEAPLLSGWRSTPHTPHPATPATPAPHHSHNHLAQVHGNGTDSTAAARRSGPQVCVNNVFRATSVKRGRSSWARTGTINHVASHKFRRAAFTLPAKLTPAV
ncbi:hypothetical protein EVAR_57169_1 [Eumeta japonica]|uniref:Uncharacterized protein n=1 Tax=Eumeta variegata TaxID=151549 RepID=A0A4C1ZXX8_EUMVA|nr:hypothetical protein EVAR_57169_1 [Eumeta japonica]